MTLPGPGERGRGGLPRKWAGGPHVWFGVAHTPHEKKLSGLSGFWDGYGPGKACGVGTAGVIGCEISGDVRYAKIWCRRSRHE